MGKKIIGKKILVVEDDHILRSAYTTKLAMEGFEVRAADSGMEGLRQAEREEPDVILLDLHMPGMSGIEMLEAYDPREKHPEVEVIVFSNLMIPGLAERVRELGAARFLTKATVAPREMVRVVRETLEKPTVADRPASRPKAAGDAAWSLALKAV